MVNTPPLNAYRPGTVLTVGSHTAIIIKYVAEGGFAHVYKVEVSPSARGENLACLKRVAVPDKASLNSLRAEVDSMKRLQGRRHIVSYIDSHAARLPNGQGYEVFVLMEYCSNKGLIDFMNSRLRDRLKEEEVLRIMAEITEGVCDMHALDPPLIHRDIKIENVLISEKREFKLCDFGSASPVLRPPRNSDEFTILQNDILKNTTAQYRSPEMIDLYRGSPIDEKSDVWALGIFLYKLCYYTTPFEAKGELAVLHSSFQFPDRPVYSDRLKNLISVLLREDPRRRPNAYQTLEEVCKMRDLPVPIPDFTKKRSVPTPQAQKKYSPSQAPPNPQISNISTSNPPFKTPSSNYALPRNNISSGTQQNSLPPPKPPRPPRPISSSANLNASDAQTTLSQQISNLSLNSKSTPSLISSQPLKTQKSFSITSSAVPSYASRQFPQSGNPALQIPQPKLSSVPVAPPKSKYVDSVVQTVESDQISSSSDEEDDTDINPDETLKPSTSNIPARPVILRTKSSSVKKRPQSMYAYPSQNASLGNLPSSNNNHNNGGYELKRIITGLSSNSTSVELSPGETHINSSMDFLKTLQQQDSGKSWIQQHTGESLSSLRRISTGSKKRNSLIGQLTGKFSISSHSRSQSRTSSRTSSIHESSGINMSQAAGNIPKYRSSSESISEEEPVTSIKPKPRSISTSNSSNKKASGSSSIQKRVQALLNKSNDPPVVKTAQGYGNDTREKPRNEARNPKPRIPVPDNDGFKKPQIIKSKPLVPSRKPPPETPPLSAQSTPSTITRSPGKNGSTETLHKIKSPLNLKKNLPPPKPKKPMYLKSVESSTSRTTSSKSTPKRKSSSSSNELSETDLEDFNKKFPSAI